MEDNIGLHSRVTQTYYGSSIDLRPALQSEKKYIACQPIKKNGCAVCESTKGGCTRLNRLELHTTKNLIMYGTDLALS